jgi:hypothetical protein
MTSGLDEADRARLARQGVAALSPEQGLELFDAARRAADALVLPVRLDTAALRSRARAETLPALLRDLVDLPARRRRAGAGQALAQRLAGVPAHEREDALLKIVLGEVAAVLGHASAQAIEPLRAFKDLGFDSLSAIELRNRLNAAGGLHLPATVIFDHPTPADLASCLLAELFPAAQESPAIDPEETAVRAAFASIPFSRLRKLGLIEPLLALADPDRANGAGDEGEEDGTSIDTLDVESLVRRTFAGPDPLIETELESA